MSQIEDQIKSARPWDDGHLIAVELTEFPGVRLIEFVTEGTETQYGHHTDIFGAENLSEAEYHKVDNLVHSQEFKDHMTVLVDRHFPVTPAV